MFSVVVGGEEFGYLYVSARKEYFSHYLRPRFSLISENILY